MELASARFLTATSTRAALCRVIATVQAGGSTIPTAAGSLKVCLITGGRSTAK